MRFPRTPIRAVYFVFSALLVISASALAQSPGQTSGHAPDERFYPLVFRHVLSLQQSDSMNPSMPEVAGTASPSLASTFGHFAKTTNGENATLLTEAKNWKAEVDPVDTQAHQLIDSIHAKTPGGRLAPGEQPPAIPPELATLQAKRDGITLRHVQRLRTAWGVDRFAQFDASIRTATQGRHSRAAATN